MRQTDGWSVLADADRSGSYESALSTADTRLANPDPRETSEQILGWLHTRISALHLLRRHGEALDPVERMIDTATSPAWSALGLAWRAVIDHFVSLRRFAFASTEPGNSALDDLARASLLIGSASSDDRVLAAAHNALGTGYWVLRLFELAGPHFAAAADIAARSGEPNIAVKALLNHSMMQLEWANEHSQINDDTEALPRYQTAAALARDAREFAARLDLRQLRRRAELFGAAASARFAPVEEVIGVLDGLDGHRWTPTAHLAVLQVALSHAHLRAGDRVTALSMARSAVALTDGTLGGPASIQAHEALAAALPPSEHSAELLSYAFAIARNRWRDRQQLLNAARMSLDYERVALQVRIADELSRSDPLTGLGNRRALEHQVTSWLADPSGPREAAILVADVDGLKAVNDTLGHAAGDEVLMQIAAHLRTCCGPDGIIVRWGGDEFVVAIPGADAAEAQGVVTRLAIGSDRQGPAPVGTSVGCATGLLSDLDALLIAADADMYRRRKERRGRADPEPREHS